MNPRLPQKNTYRTWAGATSCLACPRGTETQDAGNTECEECPVGHYNNKEGELEGSGHRCAEHASHVEGTGRRQDVPSTLGIHR